jgi:hypothetical protein
VTLKFRVVRGCTTTLSGKILKRQCLRSASEARQQNERQRRISDQIHAPPPKAIRSRPRFRQFSIAYLRHRSNRRPPSHSGTGAARPVLSKLANWPISAAPADHA